MNDNTIKNALIPGISPTAYYVANFINDEEEQEIINHVNNAPQPKWTQLSHRRLQNWGGIPHPKGMIAEEIPKWLQKYIDKVSALKIFDDQKLPNHVLINEYAPGEGIMGHTDGLLFHPIVSTITCGSHTILEFTTRLTTDEKQRQLEPEFGFLLERKSLLVLQDNLYHNYLHSISERQSDVISTDKIRNISLCSKSYVDGEVMERSTRLSLTIRHVPKTSKFKLKL